MSGRLLSLVGTVFTAALAAQTVLTPALTTPAPETPKGREPASATRKILEPRRLPLTARKDLERTGRTDAAPAKAADPSGTRAAGPDAGSSPDDGRQPGPGAGPADDSQPSGTGAESPGDGEPSGPGAGNPGDGEASGAGAGAGAGEQGVTALLTELQRLYREAEQASEAYNLTEERLGRRRAETGRLDAELAKARLSLYDSRRAAGRLARQQYQGSTSISPYVRLLLARDPQHALDQGHVIGRLARERAETVGRLKSGERKADGLARKARAALDDQLTLTARMKKKRDDVRRRLDGVEELLASLTAERLAALAELERKGVAQAQEKLLASGALGALDADPKPSEEGEKAVRYALRQIGKPYEWGAEGPSSYDCSGLTSAAWGHAGTPIPRTSEEQWARLPRVPLKALRPGDLVIYFPEATHVAMYLGDGKVVQAPRTGETVKVTPIASQPVLGAVRPDQAPAPAPATEPR